MAKWTPEHLCIRQIQSVEKLCGVWHLSAIDLEEEPVGMMPQKGTWHFTGVEIIQAKREEMLQALGLREGVALNNKKGALSWTDDESVRAVGTISKRYARRAAPSWYGYSPERRKFLSEGQKSFLVLGCVDRNTAYAVPATELEKIVDDLHRTPDRHWHIVLDENDAGGLDLVPRSGPRIPVNKFELKTG